MRNSRIIAIAGLLVIMILFGFSYYDKNTPSTGTTDQQTSLKHVQTENPIVEEIEKAKSNGESMWLFFDSTTCPTCAEVHNIFIQLKPYYQDKVKFIEIDVNEASNAELVQAYQIQFVPTTFIINSKGQISYHNVGLISVEELQEELNKVVK